MTLGREEYIEQAHFFRVIQERLRDNIPLQELFGYARLEVLATTKLPMAIDFLLTELKHAGVVAPAMARIAHYFTPYQTFIMAEAERERGRFDMDTAVAVLASEADYRAGTPTPQGLFMYQFETLSRNRLRYDHGLAAMAKDPFYDDHWRDWLLIVRRQVGVVDFADLVYVRSDHYLTRRNREGSVTDEPQAPVLFGEREGQVAWASRRKDPAYLFSALQRQLGYPKVPRRKKVDASAELLPQLLRRLERMEVRLKLLEEEHREGAFDLTKFYEKGAPPSSKQ